MTDLIRRKDALAAMKRAKAAYLKSTDNTPLDFFWCDAIAALPAVTHPTPQQFVDTLKDAAAVAMTAREAALREAAEEVLSMDWGDPFELHRNILTLIQKGADHD